MALAVHTAQALWRSLLHSIWSFPLCPNRQSFDLCFAANLPRTGWSQLQRHKWWSIRKYAGDYRPWLNVGRYTKVYLVYRKGPQAPTTVSGTVRDPSTNDAVFYMHNYGRLRARSYVGNNHDTALKSGENSKRKLTRLHYCYFMSSQILLFSISFSDLLSILWLLFCKKKVQCKKKRINDDTGQ